MTMIAGEYSGSGSADFRDGFEPAVGDTALQLFELRAHAVHGLERCVRSNARRSSDWRPSARTPDWLRSNRLDEVFGRVDFRGR